MHYIIYIIHIDIIFYNNFYYLFLFTLFLLSCKKNQNLNINVEILSQIDSETYIIQQIDKNDNIN